MVLAKTKNLYYDDIVWFFGPEWLAQALPILGCGWDRSSPPTAPSPWPSTNPGCIACRPWPEAHADFRGLLGCIGEFCNVVFGIGLKQWCQKGTGPTGAQAVQCGLKLKVHVGIVFGPKEAWLECDVQDLLSNSGQKLYLKYALKQDMASNCIYILMTPIEENYIYNVTSKLLDLCTYITYQKCCKNPRYDVQNLLPNSNPTTIHVTWTSSSILYHRKVTYIMSLPSYLICIYIKLDYLTNMFLEFCQTRKNTNKEVDWLRTTIEQLPVSHEFKGGWKTCMLFTLKKCSP